MKITKVEIKNFRILEDISLSLDNRVTLIVGRNNSGKTSFTELFYKFLGTSSSQFIFEDFSINTYKKFIEAREAYETYLEAKSSDKSEEEIEEKENIYKALVPKIQMRIFIEYEETDDLSSLARFIMDLDENRKDALLICEYSAKSPGKLFEEFAADSEDYDSLIEFLKKNHKRFYAENIFAVDAQDFDNFREINKRDVESVFISKFIKAQNPLDDQSTDKSKGLSRGFADYYKFNNEDSAYIDEIEIALLDVSKNLDDKYQQFFAGLFEDLKTFGIRQQLHLPQIKIKSDFEAEAVLKGNTQVFYDHDENLLPEAHNGLGYSKLIFMILQFVSFYEEFDKKSPKPNFQLIFIEEPEVHLHPQMQHVFIKNVEDFIHQKTGWNAQVIITTHSSHIVSESEFESIRYFDISQTPIKVKKLSEFSDVQNPDSIRFLKQYMTISKCDMLFADKVILIEGTVERLLLPEMIKREAASLLSQYISTIEVGGAYAHLFKELLNFINVQTLVITDIDAVDPKDARNACEVSTEGARTCNQTLKTWLPKKETVVDLLAAGNEVKEENKTRVAYQIGETDDAKCGRSFEEAFILKNASLFAGDLVGISSKSLFINEGRQLTEDDIRESSYDIASKIKKTDFAFDILQLDGWETPKYIKEGLVWLQS